MSNWIVVKCAACEHETNLNARAAMTVTCPGCEATLAEPTGGAARLNGEVVRALE